VLVEVENLGFKLSRQNTVT